MSDLHLRTNFSARMQQLCPSLSMTQNFLKGLNSVKFTFIISIFFCCLLASFVYLISFLIHICFVTTSSRDYKYIKQNNTCQLPCLAFQIKLDEIIYSLFCLRVPKLKNIEYRQLDSHIILLGIFVRKRDFYMHLFLLKAFYVDNSSNCSWFLAI